MSLKWLCPVMMMVLCASSLPARAEAPAQAKAADAAEAAPYGAFEESWHGIYEWTMPGQTEVPMGLQIALGSKGAQISLNGSPAPLAKVVKEEKMIRIQDPSNSRGPYLEYEILPNGDLRQATGEKIVYSRTSRPKISVR